MKYVPDCDIAVRELDLHSNYYVHFWTNTFGKDINLLTLYLQVR